MLSISSLWMTFSTVTSMSDRNRFFLHLGLEKYAPVIFTRTRS